MKARFGIVVFPGTNCEMDTYHVLTRVLGQDAAYVWHQDRDPDPCDCLILPGGFSYGDYLRTGAIARFAPVMERVAEHAARGGLVIGICNGFQILCEAGLLPGAFQRNRSLRFVCGWTHVRVERTDTPFTAACSPHQVLRIPVSHGEGNYYADPETLARLEARGQVLFRYATPDGEITPEANPNGSVANIAGITNEQGNVLGIMPHPERAAEAVLGSEDGRFVFLSVIRYLSEGRAVRV